MKDSEILDDSGELEPWAKVVVDVIVRHQRVRRAFGDVTGSVVTAAYLKRSMERYAFVEESMRGGPLYMSEEDFALWVGSDLRVHLRDRAMIDRHPDARRGRKVLSGARKGGQEKKVRFEGGSSNDALRKAVLDRRTPDSKESWSNACGVVGRRHGLTGRQVRNRVPETRWKMK